MKVVNFPLIGIVLIFVLTKYNYIDVPLDRDEDTYLYLGKCFMDGYIPYVDFYEIKPPGVFLVYGVFEKIFGGSLASLHIGLTLMQLATAIILLFLARSLMLSSLSGYWTASFFLIFCMSPTLQSFGLNSEFFIIFFLSLSFLLLVRSLNYPTKISLFFSGLFFAVAVSMRQQVVLFCIPYLILSIVLLGTNFKSFYEKIRWMALGGGSYILGIIGYVYFMGGFKDMVYWVYTRPFDYYLSSVGWTKGKTILLGLLQNIWYENSVVIIMTIFSLGYFTITQTITPKVKIIIISWLIISVLTVIPGYRFFPHYFIYIFPPLALIMGILGIDNKLKTYLKIIFNIVLVLGMLYHFIAKADIYFLTPSIRTYSQVYRQNPNIAIQKTIDYVQTQKNENDEVFVFGSEPQVYYFLEQELKQKHIYIAFAFQPTSTVTKIQNEIKSYLTKNKPKYIIHVQNLYSILLNPKSPQDLYKFMFQIEKEMYEPIYFVNINSDNSLSIYYEKEAKNQSIFNKNYVCVYQLKKETVMNDKNY